MRACLGNRHRNARGRARFAAVGLGGLLLSAATAAGAADPGGSGEVSPDRELLYVTNQGEATVSVVDMEALDVVETVDLVEHGYTENAQPHHVAVEPDGSAWYVSLISDNAVVKFDRDNEPVGDVAFEAPGLMAVHPDRDELYIARSMSAADPPQSLGLAERSEFSFLQEIDVFFPRPHALAISQDGAVTLSASLATNQFIGLEAETLRGELSMVEGPTHVVVQMVASPRGEQVVATGQMTGELLFFHLEEEGRLEPVDAVDVGAQPWHPVYDPAGEFIYVPNKEANTVSVVDAEAREVVDTLEDDSFAQPHGAAVGPEGRYLFVSNNHQPMMMAQMARDMAAGAQAPPDAGPGDARGEEGHEAEERPGTLSVIDLETRQVVEELSLGTYATGVGTRPH